MIHTYCIHGLPLKTGDIICTIDGKDDILPGEIWRMVGKLLPGVVDHTIIYTGPGGRCVEAGAKLRVIAFDIIGDTWVPETMVAQRGPLIDSFYGVAYPLADKDLTEAEEIKIRESVAAYCLAQAAANKPYNLHFLESNTEEAFYCSQLAYKAYLPHNVDLNTGKGIPDIPGTSSIIFPQEIWEGCRHKRPATLTS